MQNINVGNLLKKNQVNYQSKKWEIFEFVDYIADLTVENQSGTRSLKTVFNDCISSVLFRIFARGYSGISLIKPDEKNSKSYFLTKKHK